MVRSYTTRGTAEPSINESKYALNSTRLSCKRFVSSQARLALLALNYNLGNFLRRLALPDTITHWFLRSLLVKHLIPARKSYAAVAKNTFQLALDAVGRNTFSQTLDRIDRFHHCPA